MSSNDFFVCGNGACSFCVGIHAGACHTQAGVKIRCLSQVSHAYIVVESDCAAVWFVMTGDDAEHRGLACTVFSDDTDFVAFIDSKSDVGEQNTVADAFGEVFYLQINHAANILIILYTMYVIRIKAGAVSPEKEDYRGVPGV